MKPQQLNEFYRLLCNGTYNNVAASYAIGRYKTMKICLYLSCEPCSFIEYGDFLPQSLPNELREIFMQDGYFDEQGTATEKAQRMLVWQVWLKYYNDEEPFAAVHLFDFSDDGVAQSGEFVDLGNCREE